MILSRLEKAKEIELYDRAYLIKRPTKFKEEYQSTGKIKLIMGRLINQKGNNIWNQSFTRKYLAKMVEILYKEMHSIMKRTNM